MNNSKLYFSFQETVSSGLKGNFLSKIILEIIRKLNINKNCEINLLITDNKEIQRLNKIYRKVNFSTDVLAFNFQERIHPERIHRKEKFIYPPDNILHLGDIVISLPSAKEQAKKNKHSLKKEITILLIHGILHLCGFDHKQKKEILKMERKEKEILNYLTKKEKLDGN